MNRRREYYYPVLAYVVLHMLVWLFSWLADVLGLFTGDVVAVKSLVGSEGIRWAARNAMLSLNDVPWGTIMLFVTMFAFLNGSGLFRVVCRLFTGCVLGRNEKRALLISFLAFAFYAALICVGTVSPLNILLGVSGSLAGSPLMYGLPLFSFIGVVAASIVYGFMYGNYRSALDVVASTGDTFDFFIPAFIALIPASGIMPCIDYTGMLGFVGCTENPMPFVADIIYLIPFLYSVLLRVLENGRQ